MSDAYFDLDLTQLNIIWTAHGLVFYDKDHPLARQNGMVALHRHIMSVHLGHWLKRYEMVYFRDGDKSNISLDNLTMATGRSDVEKQCPRCGKAFHIKQSDAKERNYCSPACWSKASRKFDPTPEELSKLVWEMSTVRIAKEFGVSDKALAKRCRKYGIPKPPPGYWARSPKDQQRIYLELHGQKDLTQ